MVEKKLLDRFKDQIFIASMCGKHDVIVDVQSVSSLLHDFYSKAKSSPAEDKVNIIKTATKLIANDVRSIDYDPDVFFVLDELTVEKQQSLLPESLKIFMTSLRSKRSSSDDSLPICAIR